MSRLKLSTFKRLKEIPTVDSGDGAEAVLRRQAGADHRWDGVHRQGSGGEAVEVYLGQQGVPAHPPEERQESSGARCRVL